MTSWGACQEHSKLILCSRLGEHHWRDRGTKHSLFQVVWKLLKAFHYLRLIDLHRSRYSVGGGGSGGGSTWGSFATSLLELLETLGFSYYGSPQVHYTTKKPRFHCLTITYNSDRTEFYCTCRTLLPPNAVYV